jgi:hypothetical protein
MTRIIAARITENFLNEECLSGVVHSQFSGVLNINFAMPEAPDRLLTVLPPRFTGIPDSLVVSEAYFRQLALLPVGMEVKKRVLSFRLEVRWEGSAVPPPVYVEAVSCRKLAVVPFPLMAGA